MGSVRSQQPHAVCIPCPAQGHITPMLQLAKLLHSKGFFITFVNTEFNHKRLLKSGGPSAVQGLHDFRFETIPDGLPPSNDDKTQDVPTLCDATMKNFLAPFRDLITRLNSDPSSDVPPVTCVVGDGVMTFSLEAAQQLGIPGFMLWTASACGFMAYLHYRHLVERGLVPLKNEEDLTNGYMDMAIDWMPGLKNMRLRDVPSCIRTTDPEDIMLNYFIHETGRASLASKIILNTFDELEHTVLDALQSMLPPLYTVGPLLLLSKQMPNSPLTMGSSLWKEESGCFEWLDGRKPGSVILVNFGSVTTMTSDHLVEFAWGLANSGHDFLWVIRPDVVKGDSSALPKEFFDETKERSLLVSWCAQEKVLRHTSIGGFLTHSGWNSTIESIGAGVPMICWPFFAEQQTNCRYACTEWGNGMEIAGDVRREEVEGLIKELMGGDKGKQMRKRAAEWKEGAIRATKPGGSSFLNFEKFVKEMLLLGESI